jgi:O-methyltransferase
MRGPLRRLGARVRPRNSLTGLRLWAAEVILPKVYYVQMRPAYADRHWEADRRRYDDDHDWDHFRDGNRVLQAHHFLSSVRKLSAGDYAEVGTYRGNYARIIYSRLAEGSTLYCFDTFQGFPEASVRAETTATGLQVVPGIFSDTRLDLVVNNIVGEAEPRYLKLRKGEFPSTFEGLEAKTWRFVLLDADLYQPTKAGLECFWPRLVSGGVILAHDYLSGYPGVFKAVHEFCDAVGIVPVPWPDRVGTAVIIKPGKNKSLF